MLTNHHLPFYATHNNALLVLAMYFYKLYVTFSKSQCIYSILNRFLKDLLCTYSANASLMQVSWIVLVHFNLSSCFYRLTISLFMDLCLPSFILLHIFSLVFHPFREHSAFIPKQYIIPNWQLRCFHSRFSFTLLFLHSRGLKAGSASCQPPQDTGSPYSSSSAYGSFLLPAHFSVLYTFLHLHSLFIRHLSHSTTERFASGKTTT